MKGKWVAISKNNKGDQFYPASMIGNRLDIRLDYKEASRKDITYWKNKNVYFHACWVHPYYDQWKSDIRRISDYSKSFWVEFDADQHLNNLEKIDFGTNTPFVIPRLDLIARNFIWEVPMDYDPFLKEVNRLQLKMYDKSREKEISKDKDINVLGLIDGKRRNVSQTLRILENLYQNGLEVKAITLHKGIKKIYDDAVNFEIVENGKFDKDSVKKFHKYLERSHVFMDISYRLTAGRNIYEALYHGAYCIASNTYGATKVLFPEATVDPLYTDSKSIRDMCMLAVDNWSVESIEKKREIAHCRASIDNFVERLKGYGY